MDLGAGLCSPRSPSCTTCPLAEHCAARRLGIASELPRKAPKKERPRRFGAAFVAISADGAVLLRRRQPKGLLGGMLETPSTEWTNAPIDCKAALAAAPIRGKWQRLTGVVAHTFTHFHLELGVYRLLDAPCAPMPRDCCWCAREELSGAALPTVMRKVLTHAL